MKLYIPLIVLSLLCSCTNPHIVKTLVCADSLIADNPNKAFDTLKSIDPSDLWWGNDNAYYALLYTQAQYKNYDTIKSDSLINIAVDYYQSSDDKDKYTLSLVYKGAALGDMGLQREAIEWYKKAEQTADTSEYLTLGLINTRLAELYENSYIENDEHINRYKTALDYYRKAKHKPFENSTLSNIAKCYTIPNKDSAYYYVNQSIKLAKARNDIANIQYNINTLLGIHRYSNNYTAIIDTLNNTTDQNYADYGFIKSAIDAYAKLGKVDSAEIYLKYIKPTTDKQRVVYYMALENIALAKGDYKNAHLYCDAANKLADSIMKVAKRDDLFTIEKRFDNNFLKDVNNNLKEESQTKSDIITIVAIAMALVSTLSTLYWLRKKRIEKQRKIEFKKLQLEFKQTYNLLSQYKNHTTEMGEMLEIRMGMLKKIMDLIYEFGSNPEVFAKKISQLSELNRQSDESCQHIIKIANLLNNNLVDVTLEQFPRLSEDEILLLALSCLSCTATEICIFLQKSNAGSVYTMRTRLAAKLGALSIEGYIAQNTKLHSSNS